MNDPRQLTAEQLPAALDEARAATFAAALDLTDEQWRVPYDPGIQPTAWDLAHVAWFAEFWLLRGPHRIDVDGHVRADRPERLFAPDDDLDSARVSHRARWRMALLPRAELLDRMARQLEDCKRALLAGTSDADLYHARFSLFHELMHCEALLWTRALLGLGAPAGVVMPAVTPGPEVLVPGGEHFIGGAGGAGRFAFDNELPGRKVEMRAFAIDAAPVTNGQFLAFVEERGYSRPEFWPDRAGAWLEAQRRTAPERWRRSGRGDYEHRWFGTWCALPPDEPIVHVSAFEAEAYCRFKGRRLPTAAEWEVAAPHVRWGNMVWEWTADAFAPHPGFRPAPYHTYSAPWFHHQRELRGGAFTTHRLMHDVRYRNFFLPQRTDVFAGFRTAAP